MTEAGEVVAERSHLLYCQAWDPTDPYPRLRDILHIALSRLACTCIDHD
jgi:hypothetical protein